MNSVMDYFLKDKPKNELKVEKRQKVWKDGRRRLFMFRLAFTDWPLFIVIYLLPSDQLELVRVGGMSHCLALSRDAA